MDRNGKIITLIGNTNKEMQKTIMLSNVGEEVYIDYHYEISKYVATNEHGDEIGFFPSSL